MKFRPDKKYIYMGVIALAVIICSICFYYLLFNGTQFSSTLKTISRIAMPIIYGIVFAYLLTPVVNMLEGRIFQPIMLKNKIEVNSQKKKLMRAIAIIITMLIVLLVIYGFFSLIIPQLVRSIKSISIQFPIFTATITKWVNKFLSDNPDINTFVMDNLDKYSVEIERYLNSVIIPQMETIVKSVSLSLIGVFKVMWNFMIGIIISCYVLYNKELFAGQAKKITYALFKTGVANNIIKNCRFTSKTFIGFISGKIIDSIIIGFLCFAGTSLMQTPYAVLVSVIVGVTNVVPFFGPYLGAIPSAFLILMVNPVKCFYFVIFIIILQQFDGNFLGPKILGESTGLSGFWVIFSITIFGGLFGIMGMVIGVPIFAVLYAGVKGYINQKLEKKGLSMDTSDYLDVGSIEENTFIKYRPEKRKSKSIFAGKNKETIPLERINNPKNNQEGTNNSESTSTSESINDSESINNSEATDNQQNTNNSEMTDNPKNKDTPGATNN